MLDRLINDPSLLQAAQLHYTTHPVDWINDWIWTFDPRRKPAQLPLVLFPRQVEYIQWLQGRMEAKDDGLVEKSRDMGVTWLNVSFALWLFFYHEGSKVGFGSRKQDLVDRLGDPDAIFEKIRYALDRIPSILYPWGFDPKKHAGFMKLINPDQGTAITGEAGDNIGRGGRNTVYFKDESAFYERPQKIEAALSQNTDIQIDVSTPNGIGNPFHTKRMSYPQEKVFIFDWREDPRKGQAWYERQKERLDSVILAQEVDRDYAASAEGLVIHGAWVSAAIGFALPLQGMRRIGLDVADEGADSNALIESVGNVVVYGDCWRRGNTTQTARKAFFRAKESNADELRYDSIGVGAGVKGELSQLDLGRLRVYGINTGRTDLRGWYVRPSDEDKGKKNEDMFLNLKAQAWWGVRRRFEKTWEMANGIRKHPPGELISLSTSIPREVLKQLVMELSQPKYELAEGGKIKIESKKHMKEVRGVPSPNIADALVICFAEDYRIGGVW